MFVGEMLKMMQRYHATISVAAKLIETAKLLNSGC